MLHAATASDRRPCCLQHVSRIGRTQQALCERALAITDAKRGPDHRETINARGNLARVAMLQGGAAEQAEARAAVDEALRRLEAPPHSLSGTHPWVRKFEGFLA